MLTFDAITHTYRWKGVVAPSVTQVLGCANRFDFITREQLDLAGARGTYVHQLCELSDLDELDDDAESSGEHWPRLLAWRAFCRDYGANWSHIETLGYSQAFGVAGTVDRRGALEKMGAGQWIIDIKSSVALGKTWGLQTAAYKQIAIEETPSWAMARRATVRLLPDGTYKFDEFKDRNDWNVFAAMLTLNHWSKQNHVLN